MTVASFNRRRFLRGAGAVVALPFLESIAPRVRAAQAAKPPVRLGVFYMANGVNPQAWTPAGDDREFQLSPTLEPLSKLKDDVLVLTNLRNKASDTGDGHYVKTSGFLTGTTITKTTGDDVNANGISMDQLAAQQVGAQTRLPSLELGTEPITTGIDRNVNYTRLYGSYISWSSPTSPRPCEINPRLAFNRLFRTPDAAARQEAGDDKSILDLVQEDAKSLRGQLATTDRQKLDEYLESIRSVERRIDADAARLQAGDNIDRRIFDYIRALDERLTKAAGKPQTADIGSMPRLNPDDHVGLMLELMVLAFWSRSTHVSTFMFANAVSGRNFSFLDGVKGSHHEISHHKNQADLLQQYQLINRWHVSQWAAMLERMKDIKEGDGSLLDHSMMLFGAGMRDGNSHEPRNLPLVLAGRGGGTLATGRHLVSPNDTPLCNLYVGILKRMGVNADKFADSDGELNGLM